MEEEYQSAIESDDSLPLFFGADQKKVTMVDMVADDSLGATLFGRTLFGESAAPVPTGPLAERFTFPPFSVLSARDGEWQARKRAWIGLGIQGEVGRGGNLIKDSDAINNARQAGIGKNYDESRQIAQDENAKRVNGLGKVYDSAAARQQQNGLLHKGATVNTAEGDSWDGGRAAWQNNGTSIFDPVVCELCYRWFCPPGGQIIDPFAGGSVRGLVAGLLGFRYWGMDLRAEQIEANVQQRDSILGPCLPGMEDANSVQWRCGDSLEGMGAAPDGDFLFSCPPYGNLEQYSELPNDISNMSYDDFMAAYRGIIALSCERLKQDRFACFVVGEFRDKKTGNYRGFVADTIIAFREMGLELYNDAILVTSVGSLPVRVSGQFEGSRKLGKTHQNILCFAKGDPKKAFL